jgi:hypothetical protein
MVVVSVQPAEAPVEAAPAEVKVPEGPTMNVTVLEEKPREFVFGGKTYLLSDCVRYDNPPAQITLCNAGNSQWVDPKKGNLRTAQLNLLLNVSGPTGVCNLTLEVDGIQKATAWWPSWVNTTNNPKFMENGQVREHSS